MSNMDWTPGTPTQDIPGRLPEVYEGHGHHDHPAIGLAGPSKADYHFTIVGAGQTGLSLAGRFQALRIHYTVLERKTPGD